LNEKYQNSFFRYNTGEKNFLVYAGFENFCAKLTFFPEKGIFDCDQVCQREPEEKNFDWYLFPRMNIEASLDGKYDLSTSGQGHFQHFWGDKIYESGDVLVAHLESGYDITINDIPPLENGSSLLPEVYMLISDPEGNVQKIPSFEYTVREWAPSGNKGKKYPVRVSVKSDYRNLNLEIRVFKNDQTANLLGVEKWFGYAGIKGDIDNKPQKGWAFFSPVGIKEN
jgi:predicted secreted hydrolase